MVLEPVLCPSCGSDELKVLLASFGINQWYTDDWGAYSRHLKP